MPENYLRVIGQVLFCDERVGSGAYKNVLGIGRMGTAKIPPGRRAGRVFLVPDPSLPTIRMSLPFNDIWHYKLSTKFAKEIILGT